MNWVLIIGLVAAVITTISWIPQVIKTIRSKQTRDISLGMYVLISTGLSLWLAYGIIIKDMPIILANTISLGFTLSVLALKIKHG